MKDDDSLKAISILYTQVRSDFTTRLHLLWKVSLALFTGVTVYTVSILSDKIIIESFWEIVLVSITLTILLLVYINWWKKLNNLLLQDSNLANGYIRMLRDFISSDIDNDILETGEMLDAKIGINSKNTIANNALPLFLSIQIITAMVANWLKYIF